MRRSVTASAQSVTAHGRESSGLLLEDLLPPVGCWSRKQWQGRMCRWRGVVGGFVGATIASWVAMSSGGHRVLGCCAVWRGSGCDAVTSRWGILGPFVYVKGVRVLQREAL
jgi:hypothetical protein